MSKFWIFAILLSLGSAQAQYSAGGWSTPLKSFDTIYQANVYQAYSNIMNTTQMQINKLMLDAAIKKSQQKSNQSASRPSSATAFKQGSKRMLVDSFAQSLTPDKAQQKALTEVFRAGLKLYEDEAKKQGKPNNVALAFTYLVGVCYLVYSGEEPSEASLDALQASVDEVFGTSADFKKASDQERQTLYELFVLLATLPLAGYSVATEQNDAELLHSYRQIAGGLLEAVFRVKPERLKFTATGLSLR